MRYHGLVSIAVLGLLSNGSAQDRMVAPPSQPPLPAIQQPPLQSMPRDFAAAVPEPSPNIELELQQFRNELREFQELQQEVSRSTRETGLDSDRISLQQRKDLIELLSRLSKKSTVKKVQKAPPEPVAPMIQPDPPAMPESVEAPVQPSFEITDDVADPFSLGKVLFRSGDFANAERAFRKVEVTTDNASTLNYLIATCLRRQSKWQSATEIYKTVVESDRDPVLQDLAKWQLDNIRWHRESEAQLEQMRIDREKKFTTTKPPQAKAGNSNRAVR